MENFNKAMLVYRSVILGKPVALNKMLLSYVFQLWALFPGGKWHDPRGGPLRFTCFFSGGGCGFLRSDFASLAVRFAPKKYIQHIPQHSQSMIYHTYIYHKKSTLHGSVNIQTRPMDPANGSGIFRGISVSS